MLVAVDGNHDASFLSGTCTHTNREDDPWWRVDLLDQMEISSVRLYNRGEGYIHPTFGASPRGRHTAHPHEGWHLSNAEVYVGASTTLDASTFQCGHVTAQAKFFLKNAAGVGTWTSNSPKQVAFGDGGTVTLPCGYPPEQHEYIGSAAGADATAADMPTGRYITVMNRGTAKILSLCEVQVFGWPNPCSPRQGTSRLAQFCPQE